MQTTLFKALQLLLALFIITFVHESGHYLWARLFRMKIDRFQIFCFTVLGWTSRRSGTRYGIGWLPLGGFCIIPDLHISWAPWKKALVLSGGAINNMLLAFVLFTVISWISIPAISYNAHEAAGQGMTMLSNGIRNYSLPTGSSGLISFAGVFSDTWNWLRFWRITACCSISMAIVNLLPIPGLDGGHLLLLAIERVVGHPLKERLRITLSMLGLGLIMALIVYGNCNDLIAIVSK